MDTPQGPPRTITLCCWILRESKDSFEVDIDNSKSVSRLKEAIVEKKPLTFANIEADQLTLWQLHIRSSRQLANDISKQHFTEENALLGTDRLSRLFPPPGPAEEFVHIVIHCPDPETRPTNRHLLSQPPRPPERILRRRATVEALYQRLQTYAFIQVRGTPGSGKTTLAQLLAQRILQVPNMNVIWVSEWPINEVEESGGYCAYLEHVKGWEKGANTVFIFDEAQMTYWDEQLWRDFFRMLGDYNNLRAIGFARYGDPTSRIFIGETPIFLTGRQRVTLTAIPHADGLPPVGLLLSEEEMAEFTSVLYPQPENYFDPSFFEALFALTGGHVGATCDFVQTIATHDSYRGLHSSPGQLYTWDKFLSAVGPRDLLDLLKHAPIFMKGVPLGDDLKDPDITDVFSAVLRDGFVTNADFEGTTLGTLQLCFRNGWLHTDSTPRGIDQGHIVAYFFASSLHRWYVEWKLSEMLPAFPIQAHNILNLLITVISNFSPKRLVAEGRMGPGGIQRPLKALYQDEFNRCCRVFFNGSVVTFPESGITKPGRSDFYIPAHEWGVELVCDGDRIDEHSGRFSQEGSYMTALPLSDYVIIDCRTTCPRDPHPDIQKLYHVLFSHDFHDVCILDNMLKPVAGGIFQLVDT